VIDRIEKYIVLITNVYHIAVLKLFFFIFDTLKQLIIITNILTFNSLKIVFAQC